MLYYTCVSILWVSLTVCLGQSVEDQLKAQLQGVSSECQEAAVSCALPFLLPYTQATNPNQFLEIARSIRLGEHCRKSRKSLFCLRGLIGKDQCSDLDPMITMVAKKVIDPLMSEAWRYICVTEFKKFSIHYDCLLTEEVFSDAERSCSSVKKETEMQNCFIEVVQNQCGATASRITRGLFLTLGERLKAIKEELGYDEHRKSGEGGEEDNGQQLQQSTLPENVYARQLAIFKELLKRK